MSKNVASPNRSIWQRDLYEYKSFRCFVWLVSVPWLLLLFVSGVAIMGVVATTIFFVGLFASTWLYDCWRDRKVTDAALSPEQRLGEAKFAEWQVRHAFDDYWYLRGYFISLVLDVKAPVEGPWYDRDIVRWFIALWESEWPTDSITVRLEQLGLKAKADRDRITHLRAIAGRVGRTFDRSSHSAREAETIRSFFEEVAAALISMDHWFAEDERPDNFQPSEIWEEFKDLPLETAIAGAPFLK